MPFLTNGKSGPVKESRNSKSKIVTTKLDKKLQRRDEKTESASNDVTRTRNGDMTSQGSGHSASATELALLEDRWRHFFHFLDTDCDRIIHRNELQDLAECLVIAYRLRGQKKDFVETAMMGWWSIYKRTVGGSRMIATEDEFVRGMWRMYNEERPALVGYSKDFADRLFDCMDSECREVVSRSEYTKLMKSLLVTDTLYLNRVFDILDKEKKGVIHRDLFKHAIVQYMTGTNAENKYSYLFRMKRSQRSLF